MDGLAPGFVHALGSEGTTPGAKIGRIYNEIFEESDCVHSVKAVYSALGGVSIACLCILILLHLLLPQLRNLNGKILISCASSTSLATLFLLVVYNYDPKQASSNIGCTVLGFFGLFSNLSMFSWMSVTCFNMVWTFRMMEVSSFQSSSSRKFLYYSAFGWGFPLIFTAVVLLCQIFDTSDHSSFNPKIGQISCFVDASDPFRLLIFFHLPVFLLILLNLGGFIFCIIHIHKTGRKSRNSSTPFVCCSFSIPVSRKAGSNMVIISQVVLNIKMQLNCFRFYSPSSS